MYTRRLLIIVQVTGEWMETGLFVTKLREASCKKYNLKQKLSIAVKKQKNRFFIWSLDGCKHFIFWFAST